MKTKLITIAIIFFIGLHTFAQTTSLNNYKYVLVPNKFDFLKEANKYRLNELTQFLFNKYGFDAYLKGSNYPEDLKNNNCLALYSDVIKESHFLKTKLRIELKDCTDKVIFTSELGESRVKEYKKSYNEALRAAFKSFEEINYSYDPDSDIFKIKPKEILNKVPSNSEREIQKLKEEIKVLKEETLASTKKEVVKIDPELKKEKTFKTDKIISEPEVSESELNILYAQPINNGFQLVDSTPKVIFKIYKTDLKNVFLLKEKSAILYKKDNFWILEEHGNNTISKQKLTIKF